MIPLKIAALFYELPFPAPDGKHISAIGLKPRAALVS
jgi:hypothetical protein